MRENNKDLFYDGCNNTTLRVTGCMRRGSKSESAAAADRKPADS